MKGGGPSQGRSAYEAINKVKEAILPGVGIYTISIFGHFWGPPYINIRVPFLHVFLDLCMLFQGTHCIRQQS